MKILLDESLPLKLKYDFDDTHTVVTVIQIRHKN